MHAPSRAPAVLTALALLAAACGSGSQVQEASTTEPAAPELVAQVASFDLATGEDQRLLVGLFTSDRTPVVGGEIEVSVGHLGEAETGEDVQMSAPSTATFLPVPGKEPEAGDTPTPLEGSGIGVYETTVDLDQPGNWGAQVTVELDGETHTATAVFPVADEHRVPVAGDPAPRTDNPTIDSGDVDPAALDSRAQGEDGEVPDPELHDASIADVLDEGRPMVVVISTPVYCVSQFCGPITETVAELADQYGDRAEFVHLEVWQDFDAEQLNPAVEEWIFDPETGGNEPWVFLVGADGTIQARWDNVLDEQELVSMLEELPAG